VTTTVISAFDAKAVRQVMGELLEAGLERRDVHIIEGEEDEVAAEVAERGFDKAEARRFARAAAAGKALVAARVGDDKAERAVAIMERYEADAGEEEDGAEGGARGGEARVPVVEEGLEVGKRKVARGGVRVSSTVKERPVEETVTLREERVEAGRRRVDRELSPEEAEAAFEERTVEMTETAEEVEVEKVARVVGEVTLAKQVEEREETVRDTVRRTEVDVERVGGAKPSRKNGK
jgi:stress response protein YsnF